MVAVEEAEVGECVFAGVRLEMEPIEMELR
jgi:hypothetical protein